MPAPNSGHLCFASIHRYRSVSPSISAANPSRLIRAIARRESIIMSTDFRLKDQLPKLTQRIVQTYDEVGKINHLGHCPLPNYDEIIAATDDLKEIIFPGYRPREP